MKTFRFACQRAERYGIAHCDRWLYVKSILMTKIIMTRDEFPTRNKERVQSYRVFKLEKINNN